MKISTKGRYGLRALVDVAMQQQSGTVSIKSVAQRLGLSEPYLEQLFACLKKAGLLQSTRGAGGGYRLSCPPEAISVGAVLTALEGTLSPSGCVSGAEHESCGTSGCDNCLTRPVWEKLQESVEGLLASISLADLMGENALAAISAQLL